MAALMPSNTTAASRRKKVVTYGKSARPSISTPQLSDDAQPPEESRKPTPNPSGALKRVGGESKAANTLGSMRAATRSPDIFDVPSEDEFAPRPVKATSKLPTKSRVSAKEAGNTKQGGNLDAKPKTAKAPRPLRKPDVAKPVAPTAKQPVKPVVSQRQAQTQVASSNGTAAPGIRHAKAPQAAQSTIQDATNSKPVQRPTAKVKAASQAIEPAQAASKQQNKSANTLKPTVKKSIKASATKSTDVGIFDVPSSDEEAPLPTPKAPNQRSTNRLQHTANPTHSSTGASQKDVVESDESNASRGRKRKGSVSSATAAKPAGKAVAELSLPRRGRKYQKKADDVSPRHTLEKPPITMPLSKPQQTDPSNGKPKKARMRTVPAIAKAALAKGQSSPASLGRMLPRDHESQQTPKATVVEDKVVDDETMYEIPDALVTPMRKSMGSTPGSVTPRQKDLFHGLLGESSASKTPMPAVSSLQLSDQKPRSLLGALARSKSDLSHSAHSRKTKLIDTLKRDETSSEEDSESEEETLIEHVSASSTLDSQPRRDPVKARSSGIDMDTAPTADPQASQATSGAAGRSRLTYAKSRSYLQESNFEDELLISMDLDNDMKFDSQNRGDTGTEDEEDPASQVRGHHELKKQGQYDMFYWDTEASIEDISNKSSNSIRRSAMIDFCTKMADGKFVSQLLDSSLFQQFLKSITSNGDAVFDFTAAGAIIFILKTDPIYTVLDQICRSNIIPALMKLLENDNEIRKIAKDRKTNASKIAQESIIKFSTLLQDSVWSADKPKKLTPQLVAMKAIELAVLGLRKAGSTMTLLSRSDVLKILDVGDENPRDLWDNGVGWNQDPIVMDLAFSILEATSITKQQQDLWTDSMLRSLNKILCLYWAHNFSLHNEYQDLPTLAIKLCMNLTNNKPEACQPFAMSAFTQPLVFCIMRGFQSLFTRSEQSQRTEVYERLILTLGAMINLAELSDEVRDGCDDRAFLIEKLVNTFLEGSERAAEADSVEESESSVAVGYLSVLLGNLCLNDGVRPKVCALLPGQRLDFLVDKIKEFVRFHEHIANKSKQYEGAEGQETWQNYTARLLLVVEKLEAQS